MQGMFISILTHAGECISGRCCMVLSDYALGVRVGNRVRIVLRRDMQRIVGRNFDAEG